MCLGTADIARNNLVQARMSGLPSYTPAALAPEPHTSGERSICLRTRTAFGASFNGIAARPSEVG